MAEQATGKLVVVTGPSGVGKSTLLEAALARCDAVYSVSATTRKPRPGEVDGVDYQFVDRRRFEAMIAEQALLEWAEVYGEYYGTPAEPVRRGLAQGQTLVMDLDVQGGRQVHQHMPGAEFVFILPPNEEELRRRLAGRGSESPQAVERRFSLAQKEIAEAKASGVYNREIVNDQLEPAVEELVGILTDTR